VVKPPPPGDRRGKGSRGSAITKREKIVTAPGEGCTVKAQGGKRVQILKKGKKPLSRPCRKTRQTQKNKNNKGGGWTRPKIWHSPGNRRSKVNGSMKRTYKKKQAGKGEGVD